MKTNQKYTGFEIAVTGMSCRFPGANNWRAYWDNLSNGVESIHFLSDEELTGLGVEERIIRNENFVRAVTVLEDKEMFDSSFFDYRPEEAGLLNPLHRLFHECIWEALEDAGIDPDRNKGVIGLYAGAGDDSHWKIYSKLKNMNQEVDDFSLYSLNSRDFLSSLLSYKLNLKGPSFTINTACSTSLVAIHLACKSLLLGETKVALAGGVTVKTHQQKGYFYEEGMIFSADGHCRAFDKDATGTVISEGAGVVVLKRLQDALEDGDEIYAVIKGSAINNDGNRKVGFTAASIEGQAECIKKAHRFAKVEPESISYVETHGTGTHLGDPIEVEALNLAFGKREANQCAIGSVKTNIGHTDTAAGVAGLIKTALSLKYKLLPPSLHFKAANPDINFAGGPLYVNTELMDWERQNGFPLRAGVSSFGIGGTNAHAILEEPPVREESDQGRPFQLLTLSARSEEALNRYVNKLSTFLKVTENVNLADMSYTLQQGRKHFAFRESIVFEDKAGLTAILDQKRGTVNQSQERAGSIVFMFTGQGSQYAGMGRDLYLNESLFREEMDKGFAIITGLTGERFEEVLFSKNTDPKKINQTRYAQPLIFLFEYALSRLLMSLGISPEYMIGHSIGEYTAACIAGVFSLEEALKLVVKRGALMNALPGGSMLSIAVSPGEIASFLNDRISLAAVNGPEQIVVSGDLEAMDELMLKLNNADISFVKLHTSHAFHSAMLDPILDEFKETLQEVTFHKPRIHFVSNLTGDFIKEEEAMSPEYWCSHMRGTVRFAEGIKRIAEQDPRLLFIEVGAGNSLSTLLKQNVPANSTFPVVNLVRPFRETDNDIKYLTAKIGQLWSSGVLIDWNAWYGNEKRRKVSLPTYSFERISYPTEVDPYDPKLISALGITAGPANLELKDWVYYPSWKRAVPVNGIKNDPAKKYLLFSGSEEFTAPFKELLNHDDAVLVEVLTGDNFEKRGKGSYTISPVVPEHMDRLIREIQDDGIGITDIIYSWTMAVSSSDFSLNEKDVHLNLAYFCVVKLMQVLQRNNELSGKKIFILTDALHQVTGSEKGAYLQSLVLGLVNVIPQEYLIPCRNIDLDTQDNSMEMAARLLQELNDDSSSARIVAIRNGLRWLPDYQKNMQVLEKENSTLRTGGLYLITGGLGNVGFVLARHLIKKYQAKVILTGRKELSLNSQKEEWEERYHSLKELSKDVCYLSVDVADTAAFEKAVNYAEKELGRIDGVIHAAGVLDNRYFELIEDMTTGNVLSMFAPKLRGIDSIYQVFKDKHPDFVWITSSISTVLGGLGFGAYSAANLFMDHFVYAKSAQLSNWKCLGLAEMIFSDHELPGMHQAMIPAEIAALFEWSLDVQGSPVILETTRDLFTRIHEVYTAKKEIPAGEYVPESKGGPLERRNLSTAYAEADTETEQRLKTVFENFFGIEKIGVEDDFFELGGDSLKGMILLKRIKNEFSVNLTLRDFLSNITIRAVGVKIDEMMWFKTNIEMDNEITI